MRQWPAHLTSRISDPNGGSRSPRTTGLVYRRAFVACVASAALCTILLARVFVLFEPARDKLVETPLRPTAGLIRVEGTPTTTAHVSTVALIARIRNDALSAGPFAITIGSRTICASTVAALTSKRLDCETNEWPPRPGNSITVTGRDDNWTLDYLEVATHHGATREYDLVILPASSRAYTHPSVLAVLLTFAAMSAVLMVPPIVLRRRWVRSLYLVGTSAVVVLFALTLLSAVATRFLVLLSLRAYVECVGVLLATRLVNAYHYVAVRVVPTGRKNLVSGVVATMIVVAGFGSVLLKRLDHTYHGNYSGFIQISRLNLPRFNRHPISHESAIGVCHGETEAAVVLSGV